MNRYISSENRKPVWAVMSFAIMMLITGTFAVAVVGTAGDVLRASNRVMGAKILRVERPSDSTGLTCVEYRSSKSPRSRNCFEKIDASEISRGENVDLYWTDSRTLSVVYRWMYILPLFGFALLGLGWRYLFSGLPIPAKFH